MVYGQSRELVCPFCEFVANEIEVALDKSGSTVECEASERTRAWVPHPYGMRTSHFDAAVCGCVTVICV